MAWIQIILIILPASCFVSLAGLTYTFLGHSLHDYTTLADNQAHAAIHIPETLALTADTLLSISLFIRGFGAYKSWKGLGSVLPEVYLVVLLAARAWFAAESPFWTAQLQSHSAALYAVRFSCAVVAAGYSYYMRPGRRSIGLGAARLLLLGTLIWTQPLRY
ncbi:hypothetical protein BKA67DRAFT_553976 [Truncatella angustata]|uniref:Uncharacterized protein n=1 Tax=Truncatella angustata TaxID=152316 RepID=A0A9P8URG9_9PEZI|nr:uncharacterized protein BKA67DRAFT_553976 [Truncatella angustata]KAH6657014.1 hypothetical protein BKA67DRAFT_553976 [Truncatella angustata]